jgi:hypothetical protein
MPDHTRKHRRDARIAAEAAIEAAKDKPSLVDVVKRFNPLNWFQGDEEDDFREWVTGGGDPQAGKAVLPNIFGEIVNPMPEPYYGYDVHGVPRTQPVGTPIKDIVGEAGRGIRDYLGFGLQPSESIIPDEQIRGWTHENDIMQLLLARDIDETQAKEYLYLWFTNPDLDLDGTKHWPDRDSIDGTTNEGQEQAAQLASDAYYEIMPKPPYSGPITSEEAIRQVMEGELDPQAGFWPEVAQPVVDIPTIPPTIPPTIVAGADTETEMTQDQWNALTKEEKDWYWDNAPLIAQQFAAGGGDGQAGGGLGDQFEGKDVLSTTGVDTEAGYYDTTTGLWVKGDFSPEDIRRRTRIAQEDDYQGMQNIFNQFLTTQPMHTLSGYGQEAARAMQQPLYYSYLAGQPMPGEARDEMLFQQFLNQEGGPQIMDPTAYTQRLMEIGGYMGGEPPTEKGALAEWNRAQAPYRKNIDAFNAWLQPAMFNVAPAFRSGVYAAAQNIFDTFMEATPEQSFMGEMARTGGMFPSSMVSGGYT